MTDAPETPPTWDEAFRDAVAALDEAIQRFEALHDRLEPSAFCEDEWRVVEQALEAMAEAAERADDGYVAVIYDPNAWYRIMENTLEVSRRLESAIGVMTLVEARRQAD